MSMVRRGGCRSLRQLHHMPGAAPA